MDEQTLDTNSSFPRERPQFLSVLCILTFIGAGLFLLSSLLSIKSTFSPSEDDLLNQERTAEMFEENSPGTGEIFIEAQKNAKMDWLFGFFGNAITLAGAIMMWKLKKTGFFLYVFGEIVPGLISMMVSGVSAMTAILSTFGMGDYTYVIIGCVFLIDIVFIILYRMNLKHMS